MTNLVAKIEAYIARFIAYPDPAYSLPVALWIIGTFLYDQFDAFPYLVITSHTKRSGKTRLSELIAFACSNPRNFAAMTAPTLFRSIESERPTIIFDEAETLSSESASTMRATLNVGYRKGQTVPRMSGGTIKEFLTYCPKIFILIGDVYATLKDRSIIITMKRGEPRERFTYETAKSAGEDLRAEIAAAIAERGAGFFADQFQSHAGLGFLTDRDEEIWIPLFVLATIFCPGRLQELSAASVDIATEKTAESRRYVQLQKEETKALDDEYAQKALMDLYGLLLTEGQAISTKDAIAALRAIPVSPWRKFRGDGLDGRDLANMLSRFGVRPVLIQYGKGRKGRSIARGYKRADLEKAVKRLH